MKREDFMRLPESIRKLNMHLLDDERDKKCAAAMQEYKATKADIRNEKELQSQCENWLRQHGYYPRTPAWINSLNVESDFRGWYIHLHKTQKNPILLDLLIIDRDRNYIEIELKHEARLSKEQAQIIATSKGCCVYNFESFELAVLAWESVK